MFTAISLFGIINHLKQIIGVAMSHVWSKYKNFLFTTVLSNGNEDIRVVYQIDIAKSFFCFDDLMGSLNYKQDDEGNVSSEMVKRYSTRLKMFHFVEIFPSAVFIPVDKLKLLPVSVAALSRVKNQYYDSLNAVSAVLKGFMLAIKDREEVLIEEDIESFIEIHNHPFSVATFENKMVVKATDVLRYCGYKTLSVKDNIKDHCVKIKTKNGIANFIYLDSFPVIADEMATPKYSKKLLSLFTGFNRSNPIKTERLKFDREKSVVVLDSTVIPFIMDDDVIKFQTTIIQKICGYKNEGVLESFKRVSIKINDCHYIAVNAFQSLIESKISADNKSLLKNLFYDLRKFAS